MKIRIKDIKPEGLAFDFREDWSSFPDLVRLQEAGQCEFLAPVRAEGRAIHVAQMVEIEGRVETAVALNCSRCLKRIEESLESRFSATFLQGAVQDFQEEEEEVELSSEDLDMIPFSGEEIDLREPVQEQIVMALPIQVLCRDECRGICPRCGTDLNEEECGCPPEVFNPKFSALKNLKIDKKD